MAHAKTVPGYSRCICACAVMDLASVVILQVVINCNGIAELMIALTAILYLVKTNSRYKRSWHANDVIL